MSKNENNETNFGYKNVDKTEKPEMVKGVFDSVAENYDLMNDLMSLGFIAYGSEAQSSFLI